MISLRLGAIALASMLLAACGSSASGLAPAAAVGTTATLTIASASAQPLPVPNGGTASVSITAAAGAAANTQVAVSASTSAPTGLPALLSASRQALNVARMPLAYYAFVTNVDLQLTAFPSFTIAFPAQLVPTGATLHEAFLDGSSSPPAYAYDIARGPNGGTFAGAGTPPKFLAGKLYLFVFYYETGSAATPTPTATPSPPPSPTPIPTATASAPPASGNSTGTVTISSASASFNGIASPITGGDTTASSGQYQGQFNTHFVTIPHGQTGNGVDGAHPNRSVTLEINDTVPLSSASSYSLANKAILTYGEQFG
ncbi:MAG: hypothetical protein M3N19_00045, partial [Candidatus Eremiobacteraeota bacterium]|nr:hypothetical protein [Candidatus Eremiobacteraeota bacterium]